MDKEMLAIAKFKKGKFDTFMSWFQSEVGMKIRKSIAHVEQTVPAFAPDKFIQYSKSLFIMKKI